MSQQEVQRFAVILAGGAGERFWPLSRQQRPKQLLHLTDPDRSMIAEAVERLTPLVPRERIYVITSLALVPVIRAAGVGVPDTNVVGEPCKRNTSGALLYIAAHILAAHPGLTPELASVAVVTADHKIGAPDKFVSAVDAALQAAEQEPALVICGITPDSPETGFGYVQTGSVSSLSDDNHAFFSVKAFHEKPSREKAEEFLSQGDYYWNSGMFFWRLSTFYAEFERARPDLAGTGHAITRALCDGDADEAVRLFGLLEDISIDYALMEHARQVLMLRATFPWRDVGLWSHLEHVHIPDQSGNSVIGEAVVLDSAGCMVYNATGGGRMAVGVAGLRDVIVAVTEDAVLVIPKERAQDVRHIVAELKKRNAPQL